MPPFRDMMSGESLDHFHQRCVVPTQDETTSRNEEIDGFVRFLHSQFNTPPYTVARVLKSGSLGKGTAVRDSADIDLVVILNGLDDITDLVDQRPRLLRLLEEQVNHFEGWRRKPTLKDSDTRYSLQYTLNGQKLDILPAMDIHRVYGSHQGVYRVLTSSTDVKQRKKLAQKFSVSLAPLQIEFVKGEGEAVKRVIRLLKFWKYEKDLDICSYMLELLTIFTSKSVQWNNTENLFRNVLNRLTSCGSIKVAFNRYYDSSPYTGHHGDHYVLDPANPYMDTLHKADVDKVSREAREMLRHM